MKKSQTELLGKENNSHWYKTFQSQMKYRSNTAELVNWKEKQTEGNDPEGMVSGIEKWKV